MTTRHDGTASTWDAEETGTYPTARRRGVDPIPISAVHAMPGPPPLVPRNLLVVPCPQCAEPINVLAEDKTTVVMKPRVDGEGWRTFDITVTATGSAVHTHPVVPR
jgi:hypothetical protein